MKPNLWAVEEFLQIHLDDDNFKERFRKVPLKSIPVDRAVDAPKETLEEPHQTLKIERREAMRAFRDLILDSPR